MTTTESELYCLQCRSLLKFERDEMLPRWKCHACGWVYYNNPRPCATALIMRESSVLMTLRTAQPGAGLWDLPGGFIECGEHPEAALRREIKEELGTGIHRLDLLGIYPDQYGVENIYTLIIAYLCSASDPVKICTDEFDEVRWFPLNDLPDVYAFQSVKTMLIDLRVKVGSSL